jgi:hypothetical protein
MRAQGNQRGIRLRAGLIGGLAGGATIRIYEALVWVGAQHLMPLAGIPRNATGLVFGQSVQESLGGLAYVVGMGIHFSFSIAWIVMHAAIMVVSDNHPDYYDPMVIIGGFMSHFFFTVPMALIVKRQLANVP